MKEYILIVQVSWNEDEDDRRYVCVEAKTPDEAEDKALEEELAASVIAVYERVR